MAELEEYKVDKPLCIDCNACYTSYAEIFKQVPWEGATKAEAYAPVEKGKYNPWDVLGVCPTDAIKKIGEMPPKPEKTGAEAAAKPLEDLGPWEDRWARVQSLKESKWEVMKRYGMAAVLNEEKDGYIIRVEFPERAPHHVLTYQMGLPDKLPDYRHEVILEPGNASVTLAAWLDDANFRRLCGKINSFPDRFRRRFILGVPVELARKSYRGKVLTVELKKLASTPPPATA